MVEIGCGVGRLTRAIAPDAERVFAYDISSEMLAIAREGAPRNAGFRLAQGCSLEELPDGSADLVIAYCVFQHLPNLAALASYLQEMTRVAKDEGKILFTTCVRDWKWQLLPAIRAKAFLKEKLGLQPAGLHKKEWLGIRPTESQVRALCPVPLNCAELSGDRVLFWGAVQSHAQDA